MARHWLRARGAEAPKARAQKGRHRRTLAQLLLPRRGVLVLPPRSARPRVRALRRRPRGLRAVRGADLAGYEMGPALSDDRIIPFDARGRLEAWGSPEHPQGLRGAVGASADARRPAEGRPPNAVSSRSTARQQQAASRETKAALYARLAAADGTAYWSNGRLRGGSAPHFWLSRGQLLALCVHLHSKRSHSASWTRSQRLRCCL